MLHERGQAKTEHERLEQEIEHLRRELARNERREELGASVLESAQNTAREIRETARQEAELILKKASEHATRLRSDVEREHAARLADVEALKSGSVKLRDPELPPLSPNSQVTFPLAGPGQNDESERVA